MLLLLWDKDISMSPKYPEVGNVRFISIEYLNECFPIVMMYWLVIINVQ